MPYSATDPIAAAIINRPARVRAGAERIDADILALLALREELPTAAARELALKVSRVLQETRNSFGRHRQSDTVVLEFSADLMIAVSHLHRVLARHDATLSGRSINARAASIYHDVRCVLGGGSDMEVRALDTTAIRGASTCSSTSGGAPTGGRSFASWYDALSAERVLVSPLAQSQISAWLADPMLQPASSVSAIPAAMTAIAQGIEVVP